MWGGIQQMFVVAQWTTDIFFCSPHWCSILSSHWWMLCLSMLPSLHWPLLTWQQCVVPFQPPASALLAWGYCFRLNNVGSEWAMDLWKFPVLSCLFLIRVYLHKYSFIRKAHNRDCLPTHSCLYAIASVWRAEWSFSSLHSQHKTFINA